MFNVLFLIKYCTCKVTPLYFDLVFGWLIHTAIVHIWRILKASSCYCICSGEKSCFIADFTAKKQYRKLETNTPRKGIAACGASVPISAFCSERFIYCTYIPTVSRPLLLQEKYVDRSWKYINCWQTHECVNWDWGRTILSLGIHKWGFRFSVRFPTSGIIWVKLGPKPRILFSPAFLSRRRALWF